MNEQIINWDDVPELLSKDDFYKLCHISKSTALHLLRSGKVPCEFTGKKTRCYQIRKVDVRKYLAERAVFPELYSAPQGWYGGHYQATVQKELPEETHEEMLTYYGKLLAAYHDVLRVSEISKLTGYGTTAINNWCASGKLRHFSSGRNNLIPKVFLIEYFCSLPFRSITRKTVWHIKALQDFQSQRENLRFELEKEKLNYHEANR